MTINAQQRLQRQTRRAWQHHIDTKYQGRRNLPSVTSTQSRVIEHCSNGYGVGRVKGIISSLEKTVYYMVKSHGKVICHT